jgi:beta-barrel assembly-enhancing protease
MITTAIYFDGETSNPYQIDLFLNKTKQSFSLVLLNKETINWKITEVEIIIKKNILTLQSKTNTDQNVVIDNVLFIKNLNTFLIESGHLNWYEKIISYGLKVHTTIALALILLIAITYFYAVPFVAEKAVAIIPESYDQKLGKMAYNNCLMLDEINPEKTKTLNEFAKYLKFAKSKKLNFTVINSETINAFALPDGNIVVYTGILESMKSYEELIALIGHEATHVNNRHSMKLLCRDLSGYLFVSAILGDANAVMAVITENANSLQSLSFSREYETEADTEGFKIMMKNKVNPNGMTQLFKRLQNAEKNVSIPVFLSTHPITEDRIVMVKKLIDKQPYNFIKNKKLESLFINLKK